MDEILLIFLILAGIWYWWDTQQCNEIALLVCRQKCTRANLQLLDATVTRQRTWLRRGVSGSIEICRMYSFEYSSEAPAEWGRADFGGRELAYIVLIGKQVVETNIPSHEDRENTTKDIH
jgi:hypothetical protein